MRIYWATALSVITLIGMLAGCGHRLGYRHLAGPITPAIQASDGRYVIADDGSVTYLQDRLEIALQPMTAEMLDRQFPDHSKRPDGFQGANPHEVVGNPYTYGEWIPPGADAAPDRFTVFLLRIKNYEYPKVLAEPASISLEAGNGRHYPALSFPTLVDYHRVYALGFAGNTYHAFEERKSLLQRTLYPESDQVFSGQETQGYVVFAPLDRDVGGFKVWVRDVVLRFDYRGEPAERIDIPFDFARDLYVAKD
jgi:hypothetical protein